MVGMSASPPREDTAARIEIARERRRWNHWFSPAKQACWNAMLLPSDTRPR